MPDGAPTSRIGIAPIKVAYVKQELDPKEFADGPTQYMTLVSTVYNADTLGFRPDLIKRPIESWAELANPEFKGKASILNIPSIGIMDAGMVCQASGRVTYKDMDDMTKEEIDKTIAFRSNSRRPGNSARSGRSSTRA